MTVEKPPIRALTVKQPWATLIARTPDGRKARGQGIKDVENRSWRPKEDGLRIAIHAGYGTDREALARYAARFPWLTDAVEADRGRVLCTVVIGSILEPGSRKHSEWHYTREYGWVLGRVVPVASEPMKGKLRFWHWTPPTSKSRP